MLFVYVKERFFVIEAVGLSLVNPEITAVNVKLNSPALKNCML